MVDTFSYISKTNHLISPLSRLEIDVDLYLKYIELEFQKTLPYHPGNRTIEGKTLPVYAMHYNDTRHLDVHNLYGLLNTYETYLYLKNKNIDSLPFVLTRSTFPGSGKYGFHWTGDNRADWHFLNLSIPAMFNFNVNNSVNDRVVVQNFNFYD